MAHAEASPTLYGLMAEFETPTALVTAAERARLAGYRNMDAYSPIPIEELNEALGLRRTRLPMLVLAGGILGGLAGYGLRVLVAGDRVPAEHRRPAVPQLAALHPRDLRDDGARRGAVLRLSACGC